jgi:hypothetical protein
MSDDLDYREPISRPQAQVLATITNPTASGLPAWTVGSTMVREPDGRIFLKKLTDGGTIWFQPKGWSVVKPIDPAANYGVMPRSQDTSGHVHTNDPDIGRAMLGGGVTGQATTGQQCPIPLGPKRGDGPSTDQWLMIGFASLVVVLLAVAVFRKGSR